MSIKYEKAIIVNMNDVSSKQVQKIRFNLRELKAEMIMGKNTLMKASLNELVSKPDEKDEEYAEKIAAWKPRPEIETLIKLVRGNTGIIFSNGDLGKIKEVIDAEAREAPAKAGALAPLDVWIRAGSTGLDPKQTAFFQALNIPTKIVKTQIEIQNDKCVITKGQKVELTHCALLDKLNIRPFSYKMEVVKVFDKGQVFSPDVLDISTEDILKSFSQAINNVAAFGMVSGYVTKPAAAHMMAKALQNLVYATHNVEDPFPLATKMRSNVGSGPAVATGSAPAEKKEEKPVEEEVEADVDMGGMFGDDDGY